jgi:hypothetical protein
LRLLLLVLIWTARSLTSNSNVVDPASRPLKHLAPVDSPGGDQAWLTPKAPVLSSRNAGAEMTRLYNISYVPDLRSPPLNTQFKQIVHRPNPALA